MRGASREESFMNLEQSILDSIEAKFQPRHLDVINESHSHNVPANSETHFKVVLVSAFFEGKPSVSRHRAVYEALAYVMENGVHALALHTYTPEEWAKRMAAAPASPNCLGGGGQGNSQ